jgi:hypothetical protein
MGSILSAALAAADTFLERAPNIAAVVGLLLGLWNWLTRRQDKFAAIVEAANVKADALAQAETQRRTTFELETLRMLARLLDETNVAIDEIYHLPRKIATLWMLIPAGELPFWQLLYDSHRDGSSPDLAKVRVELESRGLIGTGEQRWIIHKALQQDLITAIHARVSPSP